VPLAVSDFESLYQDHHAGVYRFIFGFVQNAAIADELAQDVFIKAYRARETFRGEASPRVWLIRIARNVCLDWLRSPRSREARNSSLEQAMDQGLEPDHRVFGDSEPELTVEQQARIDEMSSCVQDFITTLPEILRTPLVLHDTQGYTNKEVASVLECSVEAAKMRLHRARRRLKQMMEENCDLFGDERNVLSCLPIAPDRGVPALSGATDDMGYVSG
jgi:RNA polymerase sigma-70 factor (ECF subfamily)